MPLFRRLLAIVAILALLPTPQLAMAEPDQAAPTPSFVRVSGDHFVVDDTPFVMHGFNYYPRDYGWSAMTDWDWSEVDQELGLAASLGANTIRTVVDYGFSTDHPAESWLPDEVVRQDRPTPAYLAAMDHLLSVADRHGMRVVFSLFDFMPGWSFIDAGQYAPATTYARTLVSHFAHDPRVAAWDILNEGDMLPDKFPATTLDSVLRFYAAISAAIKSTDHVHLVTADFGNIERASLSQTFVDYVSFHYYADPGRLQSAIAGLRGRLQRPMPVVAGELGAPSDGNPYATLSSHTVAIAGYLDIALGAPSLAGALVWTLVDPNPPKTTRTRQSHMDLIDYGVFDHTLQPKPSAQVVHRSFAGQCGPDQRIELRFPDARPTPTPTDSRLLSVGLHELTVSRADGSMLSHLTFGTLDANAVEGRGWYANESWGQWAGGQGGTATLCMSVAPEAATISLTAHAVAPNTQLQVWVNGSMRGAVSLQTSPSDYVVALDS